MYNKSTIKKAKTLLETGYKNFKKGLVGLEGSDENIVEVFAHKEWKKLLAVHGIRMEPIDVVIGIETLRQTIDLAIESANQNCVLLMHYTNAQFKSEMIACSEGEGSEECIFVYIVPYDMAVKIATKGLPFGLPKK
jgi:hypothetical protein